ncbi:MAG: tail fiber domain-containing protein, partial [Planctomycetes bacterium]|nr:tail fiber domain-containing protein [Planctomycetota bacterium]
MMKIIIGIIMMTVLVLSHVAIAQSLSTAFTYQGRLTDGGVPVDAKYDFKFSLFDALIGGRQIDSTQTPTEVGVYDGYFTVVLDFGVQYWGNATWLEIEVAPHKSGTFTLLTPRKPINPTPQALYAKAAESVVGGIGIDGTGSAYYVAKFMTSKVLGNSIIVDDGTNIGIGTTAPAGKLQVTGDEVRIGNTGTVDYATGDGDLYVEDTLEVDGDAYFASGTHHLLGTNYTSDLLSETANMNNIGSETNFYYKVFATSFASGSNPQYYLNPITDPSLKVAGSVGIGTTSPQARLEVNWGADNNLNPLAIFETNGDNSPATIRFQNADNNYFSLGITSNNEFALGYNHNIPLSSDLMRITSAGNVGLGTINPVGRLHVVGDEVRIGSGGIVNYATGDGDLYIEDNLEVDGNVNLMSGNHYIYGTNYTTSLLSGNTTYNIGSASNYYNSVYAKKYYDGNDTSYYLDPADGTTSLLTAGAVGIGDVSPDGMFEVNPDGIEDNGNEFTVDSGGRVGIGEPSTSYKLEIGGINDSFNYIRIKSTSYGYGGLMFFDGVGSYSGEIIYQHGDDSMCFETNSTEQMRITSDGNVGIGTDTPGTYRLDVAGSLRVQDEVFINNDVTIKNMTGTTSGDSLRWFDDKLYFYSSSQRFKEDIQPLKEDFDKILEIKPKSFIDTQSKERNIGYIAEEFDELGLKHLVTYKDGQPNAIKYELVSL